MMMKGKPGRAGQHPAGRGRAAVACRRRRMVELAAADAPSAQGQGGAGRFLDLLLHQLPARDPLRPRLGGEIQGSGPRGDRRACAGIRLREERRQRRTRSPSSKSTIRWRSTTTMRSGARSTTSIGRRIISSTRKGRIRHHHFGEGDYDESEKVIQQLLAEAGKATLPSSIVSVERDRRRGGGRRGRCQVAGDLHRLYARPENFASPGGAVGDTPMSTRPAISSRSTNGASAGDWTIGGQYATLNKTDGAIAFRFHARDLHLVLGPGADGKPVRFRVTIDGAAPGESHGADVDADGEGCGDRPAALSADPAERADHGPHVRDPVPRSRRAGLRVHLWLRPSSCNRAPSPA